MKRKSNIFLAVILVGSSLSWLATQAAADDEQNRNILKQGLLGAGVGAISASASGGKAGKGALIGAGTSVIGGALLDSLTGPSQPQQQQVQYVQAPPQYVQAPPPPQYAQSSYPPPSGYPVETQPVYVQQVPAYQPPQEDPNKKILKQGLLGAGVGAISAGASGGNAGQGALIGAGTNVIGGALLDTITTPSRPQPQPVYVQQAPAYPSQQYSNQPGQGSSNSNPSLKKHIIRKYDSDGKVISEEEVWE